MRGWFVPLAWRLGRGCRAGSALAGGIARWGGGVPGGVSLPPPCSGVSLSPLHLVPALQRVSPLEVELNPFLGLLALFNSRVVFWGGGTCRLPSPSAMRCHLWAQRTRAVAKPGMWVGTRGAGRHRPAWRGAGGGSPASDFTLALEERDIPASLGYWCSWEPLGHCPKRRGRERVGFETLHKQDGRSGRCRAPGAQGCVRARRWGRGTGPCREWRCPAHRGSDAGSGRQRHSSGSGPFLGCRGDGPQPPLGAEHAAPMRMSMMVLSAPSDAANPAATR